MSDWQTKGYTQPSNRENCKLAQTDPLAIINMQVQEIGRDLPQDNRRLLIGIVPTLLGLVRKREGNTPLTEAEQKKLEGMLIVVVKQRE